MVISEEEIRDMVLNTLLDEFEELEQTFKEAADKVRNFIENGIE